MKYQGIMDIECIQLCDAINKLKGLKTTECCCGHDVNPFRIWFKATGLKHLPQLLYYMDG